jgi:hypothetical protein
MKRECTQQVQEGKIVADNNWLFLAYLSLQRGKEIKTYFYAGSAVSVIGSVESSPLTVWL